MYRSKLSISKKHEIQRETVGNNRDDVTSEHNSIQNVSYSDTQDDEPIDMTRYTDIYQQALDASDNSDNSDLNTDGTDDTDDTDDTDENIDESSRELIYVQPDSMYYVDDNESKDDSEILIDDSTHKTDILIDNGGNREKKNVSELLSTIENTDNNRDICHEKLLSVTGGRGNAYRDGYLKIVIGCMFSGKTTDIIRECQKWRSIYKRVLLINYALDRRYTDKDQVVSHDRLSIDCMMIDKFTPHLSKIVDTYDVILINEAQFFNGLAEYVKHWVDVLKKIVVVSGLDGDYMRNKFGEILDLIPCCDDLVKLKAYCSVCKDGTEAIFTWKTADNPITNKSTIEIGTDKYVALCRKHYNNAFMRTLKRENMLR